MRRGWAGWTLLLASPLVAETPIDLPGCDAPPQVAAASRLPSELGRACGSDAGCWRAGLERAERLAADYPATYDAHRVRILVARAAAAVLGPAVVDEAAAEYERLARATPEHPAYAHLLAQLRLEGDAYGAELARLAAGHPGYPWVQLSIAYLHRPDSDDQVRDRARTALERFVEICPTRYDAAVAPLERIGDASLVMRLAPALRAQAVDRGDFAGTARLWALEARASEVGSDASARFSAAVRGEISRLTRGGLPSGLDELEALRLGHEIAGDPAGVAAIDRELLAVHPCSMPARRARSIRLEPRLDEAAWLAVDRRRAVVREILAALEPAARCPGDESARLLRIRALARLGPEAETELAVALDQWLATPATREAEPEIWAAERWIEAGTGLERLPGLLERARARRSALAGEASSAGVRELAVAAEAAVALESTAAARSAIGRLRTALEAEAAGYRSAAAREALDRLDAALRCAEHPDEEAVARFGELLARAPEGSPAERAALRCWVAARGGEDGFVRWRREVSKVETASGVWRSVDEAMPPVILTDLGGEPIDWATLAGRTVLVRAWAGWCGPCREELPALSSVADRLANRADVAILLASVEENPSSLVELVARDALPVDAAFGGSELIDSGWIERVPAAWIVSPAGRVVRRQEGAAGDDPAAWVEATAAAIAEVAGPDPSLGPLASP
jgi:thiol-disulfide isomerase/thioredoxin